MQQLSYIPILTFGNVGHFTLYSDNLSRGSCIFIGSFYHVIDPNAAISSTETRTIIYSAISAIFLIPSSKPCTRRSNLKEHGSKHRILTGTRYDEFKQEFITSHYKFPSFQVLSLFTQSPDSHIYASVCTTIKPRRIAVFEIIITLAIKLISSALILVKTNTKQRSVCGSATKFILKHH